MIGLQHAYNMHSLEKVEILLNFWVGYFRILTRFIFANDDQFAKINPRENLLAQKLIGAKIYTLKVLNDPGFIQKSGFISFFELWIWNFMQKFRNKVLLKDLRQSTNDYIWLSLFYYLVKFATYNSITDTT